MRIAVVGLFSLLALGGCATVSMAPASMLVASSVSEDQSDFRDKCSSFSEAVYERGFVTKTNSFSQVFNMLAHGDKVDMSDTAYRDRVQIETASSAVVFKTVSADATWVATRLDEITAKVEGLLTEFDSEDDHKTLRKDIVAFEEALVLAKKSRVSFLDVMAELADQSGPERTEAETALMTVEASIDRASRYIDKLSDAYAALTAPEAVS
ncbi:MAG: hypothetical protein AAGB16_05070 [Pseudomonadota bacterium]